MLGYVTGTRTLERSGHGIALTCCELSKGTARAPVDVGVGGLFMLGGLILENFKAFGQRQEIPLAPITLIFGANGAGKTSILQSLLLLKQTLAQAETSDAVLVPRGSWVDLGNFREFVFEHDTSRAMEITPLLVLPTNMSVDPASGDPAAARSVTLLGTGFQFRFDEKTKVVRVAGLPSTGARAAIQRSDFG